MGGKLHLRIKISGRPIANKYREGKMRSTLERELKVLETVDSEADRRGADSAANQPCVGEIRSFEGAQRLEGFVVVNMWCTL